MNKEHKNAKDLDLEVGIKALHTGHKPKLQQKHGQTNFRLSFGTALLGTASFQSRETTILYLLLHNQLVWLIRLFAVRKFGKIKLDLSLYCSVTMTFNQKFRERIAYIVHKKWGLEFIQFANSCFSETKFLLFSPVFKLQFRQYLCLSASFP